MLETYMAGTGTTARPTLAGVATATRMDSLIPVSESSGVGASDWPSLCHVPSLAAGEPGKVCI